MLPLENMNPVEATDSKEADIESKTGTELSIPDNLPPEIIDIIAKNPEAKTAILRVIQATEIYTGKIPHPRTLKGFEEVVPGSARMIFDDFQEWGKANRQAMLKEIQTVTEAPRLEYNLNTRGQYMTLGIVLVIVISAVYMLGTGNLEGGGILLGFAALGSIAQAFLQRTKNTKSGLEAESPKDK